MRNCATRHVQNLRSFDLGVDELPVRRVLNIGRLLQILHGNLDETVDTGVGSTVGSNRRTSKKRKATSSNSRQRKRIKKSAEQHDQVVSVGAPADASGAVVVYRHTMEVAYIIDDQDAPGVATDIVAQERGWVDEERIFVETLQKNARSSDDGGFDIGHVYLYRDGATVSVSLPSDVHTDSRLMVAPHIDAEFDPGAHDIHSPAIQDPIAASIILRDAGRINLTAQLRFVAPTAPAPNSFPFTAILEVEIAFLPRIFEPILHAPRAMLQLDEAQRRVLSFCFPPAPSNDSVARTIDIPLLYSALQPAPYLQPPTLEAKFQPQDLATQLLPFQRRSVAWMLSREGKTLDADGRMVSKDMSKLPLFWERVPACDGVEWFYNRLTGAIAKEPPAEDILSRGGILAEEPGLGKTLECIALVMLNPAADRKPDTKMWDANSRIHVKKIKTTLIVTPASLAQQWVDELATHAPSLKVLVFDGWSKLRVPISEADLRRARERSALAARKRQLDKGAGEKKSVDPDVNMDPETSSAKENDDEERLLDWCAYVNTFDVCITTYNVLQHELGIARPPPNRPRRTTATYVDIERCRSPLIMCEWYRVIMDEVQMVGGGKAEEMVSLIPRVSSFAVSGTPARSQVSDLIHVLNFLRVQPLYSNQKLWPRLLKPAYAHVLLELFNTFAVRTMKAAVKDELTIPQQTRYLVPITLGKVEKHVYDQNFENALIELGMDARGVAVSENWQIDTGALRAWLRRLRGICTHPQVGQLQNVTDKSGNLKTIGQVLEDMKEQNWRQLVEDWKLKVQALTTRAQYEQRNEGNLNRYQAALDTLLLAEKEATRLIAAIESAIERHRAAGSVFREQASKEDVQPPIGSHKGKERDDVAKYVSTDLGEVDLDDNIPRTAAGEAYRNKKLALQQRLREAQIAMHKVQFIKGDVYNVLGERYSVEERAAYTAAEDMRRVLLKSTSEAARNAMAQLLREGEGTVQEQELHIIAPYLQDGSHKFRALVDEVNDMIEDILNPQTQLLFKWRAHLVSLLTQALTSEDADADGQEYARSLETQGEAETYLQAYATLLADRREAMTSERTLLDALDVKEKKARKTKAATKAAEALEDLTVAMIEPLEEQPENQVLQHELNEERRAIMQSGDPGRAVRSVMVDLNNAAARIARKTDAEKIFAADAAKQLRDLLSAQGKLMDKLQSDLVKLRKAFNDRILYFRQLQEISDTVTEIQWNGSLREAMDANDTEQANLDAMINAGRARQRYLDNLASTQADGTADSDEEGCILCKCEFTRGYVTACAHVFCESCMNEWLVRKEGKACPICRVAINKEQLRRFATEQQPKNIPKARIALTKIDPETMPKSRRKIEYNVIDETIFESIRMMECHGSYGSKIQTLVQHLLYVDLVEPGAKSIVFSAWADSLRIIEHALTTNGVTCLRIDQGRGKENAAKKFRSDPSIQVLLLHGDRENAGLNVTCASRVFLVESVVHHAFEVQAIARIDRMGQTRPTEVYCYYAESTVERNILDLAARQGLSLYTKDNSDGTLTAAPIAAVGKKSIDAPGRKAQKGDFVFKTDDMLAIFFPHLFEDLEYLLPPDETESGHSTVDPTLTSRQVNAEAGPSRRPYI